MSDVLTGAQRRALDTAVQRARVVSESAAAEELRRLAVAEDRRPDYLSADESALRVGLRDKARQLGDATGAGADLALLRADIAYEQWHRLLFARFLEVNGLLREPTGVIVSLEDCGELAAHEREPDGWSVAAKYAAAILPGVFRLADPSVQVRFSPERRAELEAVAASIDREVFVTEDALGWVYQFWQTAQKKRVNDSGRKIGGADISAVTQLFTENYMVRFLLENSLGAWWAARHPDSPLVGGWEYLRRLEDGTPVAGTFDEWPETAGEITVMDPCCGSGHFLVAAFGMLWRMRAEEEGLSPAEAQDAVLRDNLFGLELDPRCTQIATFNVVLEAWKQGGYRALPTPQIGCSGIPVRGSRDEWEVIAGDDQELRSAMRRLHTLFRNADSLGSLIDPRPRADDGALVGTDLRLSDSWPRIRRLLQDALASEELAESVTGDAAIGIAQASSMLSGDYTLVATNVPYLGAQRQDCSLESYLRLYHPVASGELAAAFVDRWASPSPSATFVAVIPETLGFLRTFRGFRDLLIARSAVALYATLGAGAFREISGEVVQPALMILSAGRAVRQSWVLAVRSRGDAPQKAIALRNPSEGKVIAYAEWLSNRNHAFATDVASASRRLSSIADGSEGLSTGDNSRYVRRFWEQPVDGSKWAFYQGAPGHSAPYAGLENAVRWDSGSGEMAASDGARVQGLGHLGKRGLLVGRMSRFRVSLYLGGIFDKSCVAAVPRLPTDLRTLWEFGMSGALEQAVRSIDTKLGAATATVLDAAMDVDMWRERAEAAGPLPGPYSYDPTQWLFKGTISNATEPLQVAVARLLGYRWPDQVPDDLDDLADADGIVALPALLGELEAASRLRTLLARAYGEAWSPSLERQLVTEAGGKNGVLADWLRDTFFSHHCKVFGQRPFLWHIWDGLANGFSAVVNYHRLDNATLAKLTFTTLGGWIDRQRADKASGITGADTRLVAAQDLQRRLQLILDGAPPHDVFVRWRPLAEQPVGWRPDLDDGVRLNIRPFVTAEVLRGRVNVHWKKDRGTNPDGTERQNDRHPDLDARRAARAHHDGSQP